MIIRIDSELKQKVNKLAKYEGKNLSELVRDLLENYTRESDLNLYIDDIWDKIGNTFIEKGKSLADIDSIIREVRSENK